MKYLILINLVFIAGIRFDIQAQMSGTYTIGHSGCNFTNFQQAINALIAQGTAGDVDFQVHPGNYAAFYIADLLPASTEDSVTFRAFSSTQDEVFIRGEIIINNSKSLFFRSLRFEPLSGQQNSCVDISGSSVVTFDSCDFINPYPNCFTTLEALFSSHLPFSGVGGSILVKNSLLSSPEYTIYASGAKGVVNFLNDTINGTIDIFNSGVTFKYTGNVFNLTGTDFQFTEQTFRGNTFNAGFLYLQGDFYDNLFYCGVDMFAGKIYGNHFYSTFNTSHCQVRISHNIFEQNFNLVFANGSTIDGNRFLGEAHFSSGQLNVIGNLFHDYTEFSTGPGFTLKHNNFQPDALLFFWDNLTATVENNNIGDLYIHNYSPYQQVALSNNNFIPHENSTVSAFGSNPFFYNPLYNPSQSLHATNPALIRKSTRLYAGTPGIVYDIDSVMRKTIPTIGANEICVDFQTDTTYLLCDSLCLDLCPGVDTGFYWSPGYVFIDSTSVSPVIRPKNPVKIYLNQPVIGKTDSMFVNPSFNMPAAMGTAKVDDLLVHFISTSTCYDSIRWNFGDGTSSILQDTYHQYAKYGIYHCKLFAYNQMGCDSLFIPLLLTCLPLEETLVCGDSLRLTSCIDDFAGFYWSPAYLFRDSSEANPVIYPEHPDWVFLNHTGFPGVDYFRLFVYPNYPSTSLTFSIDSLTVRFTSTVTCADNIRWDFGDGTSSVMQNPVHVYPNWGVYIGRLYGFSLVGSDTSHFTITMTGVESPDKTRFRIWPNPVIDILNVQSPEIDDNYVISILDFTGRKLYECHAKGWQNQINLSALVPGVYFIRLQSERGAIQRKFIKR